MISELELRKFNDKGIETFRTYLDDLRGGSTAAPPYDLLTGPGTSCPVEGKGRIALRKFETRLDVARYLDEALVGIKKDNIENDVNLWSWLSLFYFDAVCPPDPVGHRRPGRDYRHILEPGYPNGHRHLIGGAYLVKTVYGLSDEISHLLLHTPPHIENKFNHELAGRQNFITNKGIMEAAFRLYFDPSVNKPKRGAQLKKKAPGTLYRFIGVIQQLDLNYDLYSMSSSEIIGILPAEFDKWKVSASR